MTQNLSHAQEDDMLAAEYAMGLLTAVERKDFEIRLVNDRALVAQLRFWEEKFAPIAGAVEPIAAPKQVWQNIEKRLFAEAQPAPSWLQSLAFWRGLSFASLAAFAIAGGLYLQQPKLGPEITQTAVAEVVAPDAALKLVVLYDSEKGQFKLNRVAGTAALGRDYELWLVAGNDAPVSLGVLPAAQQGTLTIPAAFKDKLAGSILAISDEPTGGSPTGKATGPVVATGTIHFI